MSKLKKMNKLKVIVIFIFTAVLCVKVYPENLYSDYIYEYNNLKNSDIDSDMLSIFMKYNEDNKKNSIFSIYINPYLSGVLDVEEGGQIYLSGGDDDNELLGKAWIKRDFNSKSIVVKYLALNYKIDFKDCYRFMFISYDDSKKRLTVEYSKYPLVIFH